MCRIFYRIQFASKFYVLGMSTTLVLSPNKYFIFLTMSIFFSEEPSLTYLISAKSYQNHSLDSKI